MKTQQLRNHTFQSLVLEDLPGHTLRNKVFGNLVSRAIDILEEVDQYLPTYEQIYNHNTTALLNVLTYNKVNFQVTQTDGFVYLNVKNHNDKFELKTLRANQFPAQHPRSSNQPRI